MTPRFTRLDHILVTIPPGRLQDARTFYTELLGLEEIPGNHPGGAIWFNIAGIQLHITEETGTGFSERHAAFEVTNLTGAKAYLESKGIAITYSSGIRGRQRFFFRDPFGNRFELLAFLNE